MHNSSNTENFLTVLKNFLDIQEAIMLRFQAEYNQIKNWDYMLGCPRSGILLAVGKMWDFQKHGAGVRFEANDDHIVIDIDTWKRDMPRTFNASRLVDYFDSIGLESITCLSGEFPLLSEADISKLINSLMENEWICVANDFPRLYAILERKNNS